MSQESKSAILSVIQTIVKKFPNSFLNDKTELVYYPLILELEKQCKKRGLSGENQSISQIIQQLREILQHFVKVLNDENFSRIISITVTWLTSQDKLKGVALNSILVLSQVSNGTRLKSKSEFYQVMLPEITHVIEHGEQYIEKHSSLLLECLECIYSLFNNSLIGMTQLDEIYEFLLNLICSNHEAMKNEVRVESLRIFELYVSKKKKKLRESRILNDIPSLEKMIFNICNLFRARFICDDSGVVVIVKVFIYIFGLLLQQSMESSNTQSQDILHRVFKLLKKISNQSEDYDTNETMTFRRHTLLKLFVGLCAKYQDRMQPYLIYMTPLLYRCIEFPNRDKAVVTDELERFAKECKQLMIQYTTSTIITNCDASNTTTTTTTTTTTNTAFTQAYEQGRKEVEQKSSKKSILREQKVLLSPTQFAKKRLESNLKKNMAKKRKLKEQSQEATVQVNAAVSGQVKKKKLK
nr:unnamed protein product [Naegleria fowleri]